MLWDVIVMGAGPAGIAAAAAARRAGGSVLLLDRKQFPRPKACAGMLSQAAIRHAPYPLGPSLCGISRQSAWHQDKVQRLLQERNGLSHRIELDQHMLESALADGLPFLTLMVRKIVDAGHQVRLMGSDHTLLTCKVLIAADGATSRVRDLIGLPSVAHHSFSIEADTSLTSDADKTPALFDFDSISGGYGWIFPKGSSSNIGIAIMQKSWLPTAKQQFQLFCQQQMPGDIVITGKVRGAAIGSFSERTCLGKGSILLCGDAAGLADPVTGEGISSAFISGKAAGEAAISSPGTALDHYAARMQGALRKLASRLGDKATGYASPPDA